MKNSTETIILILAANYAKKHCYIFNHKLNDYNKRLAKKFNLLHTITKLPCNLTKHSKKLNFHKTSSIRLFTSGSTGEPKCVVLYYKHFLISAHNINSFLNYSHSHLWLCQLPLCHVSGLSILFRTLLANASMSIETLTQNNTSYSHISIVPEQLDQIIKIIIRLIYLVF